MSILLDNKNFALDKIFVIKKIKKSNFWAKDEDKLLLEIIQKSCQKSWFDISKHFVNKSPAQCSARYLKIKPGIKKGHWSKEEDCLILDHINKNGIKWSQISELIVNRSGKQIRDRYLYYLDKNINRNKFSKEEDKNIKDLYIKYGSKWTRISKYLDKRTSEMIKNRFYSFIKPKIHVSHNRKYKLKGLRLNYSKKNRISTRSLNHNKLLFKIEDFTQKTDELIREKSIELIFNNNNTQANSLSVCYVDNCEFLGKKRPDFSNLNHIDTIKFIEEKFFENPLNITKFAYFYLENSKKLLKKNYFSNNY